MLLPCEYHRPGSIDEAIALLHARAPDLRLLAGGTALLPALERRQTTAAGVIDLTRLEALRRLVPAGDGGLTIGGMVTLGELTRSAVIRELFPILSRTARQMATSQVRNLATVGGNLCADLPHADLVVSLLVLDARLELVGPDGRRRLSLTTFYAQDGQLNLRPGELVDHVRLPPAAEPAAYRKLMIRRAADLPLANVAVSLRREGGRIAAVRIAAGGCGGRPRRLTEVENELRGQKAVPEMWDLAARRGAAVVVQVGDRRGSAAYRRRMVGVLIRRAFAALDGQEAA